MQKQVGCEKGERLGNRAGSRQMEMGRASFAVEVESGDFLGGTEEAAQVLVLQGGPEALETPSSASTIP